MSSLLACTLLLSGTAALALALAIALLRTPPTRNTQPMSRSTKKVDEENIAQFCAITGASVKEAKTYLNKYKRVDVAVDSYYNDGPRADAPAAPSTSALNAVFNKYKDEAEGDVIKIDGTIRLCEDLGVDPEDVVLLAVAYELKSPAVGEWTRKGWVDGWRAIGADTLPAMKAALPRLRTTLGSDAAYFAKVYAYTFDFARAEGQRSLATDTAQAFWALLLPHALAGGALARDADGDAAMRAGWQPEYTGWWFEFLAERGGRGVSKDTWTMFLQFVRTIDSKFEEYDLEAAWPSTIDDFVTWAKARVDAQGP